jgi:SAM-dependent methyltransferase
MNTRELIRKDLPFDRASVMEIGPLNKPFIRKDETNVIYVDHADTATLRQKYAVGHGFDPAEIVDVDAVWGRNSLADCLDGRKVDYVIASHVVEHVPDLITWLKELSSILNESGEIRLVVPDKRFTFDYTRRPTEMPEVIEAYVRRARRPQLWNILDHVLNVRSVDGHAAWEGPLDLDRIPNLHTFEQAFSLAESTIHTEDYHDVHCWVFTPESFAELMATMVQNGLMDLECREFRDTQKGTIEFAVFLRRGSDVETSVASWKRMAASARQAQLSGSGDASQLRDEVVELKAALERARAELDLMKGSRSWRITSPLRRVASLTRSVRPGPGH